MSLNILSTTQTDIKEGFYDFGIALKHSLLRSIFRMQVSKSNSEKPKIFFPNLDALRFFSFLVVFFAHSFSTESREITGESWYRIFKYRMFSDGDLGVSFFFVLSGFLITYLIIKEKESTGRVHLRSFYIRRALRIWPLYYFCVLFGFLIFPILKSRFGLVANETANPWLCSLFLNNFNAITNGPPDASVLSVLWSVAIEEQFYLVWPIFFYFLPPKNYVYLFIMVILLSLVYRLLGNPIDFSYHTFSVISDMAVGGLGAYMVIYNARFRSSVSNGRGWVQLLPYVFIAILLLFRNEVFASGALMILSRLITGLFFVWIILEQNFCENSFFKLKNLGLATYLGKYTYGLYCLHTIALLVVVTILAKFELRSSSTLLWLVEFPLSLGLSIAMAIFSYRFYESRFLKLKRRFAFIVKD